MLRSRARVIQAFMLFAVVASSTVLTPLEGTAASTISFVDYAQCANGAPPGTSNACPGGWINGILQSSNSHYREGDVTPQRLAVRVAKGSNAAGHSFTLKYQARKGTIHAYDSLATWNFTQTGLTDAAASRCAGLNAADCAPGSLRTELDIPDDPTNVPPVSPGIDPSTKEHMIPAGAGRKLVMFGGTLTGMTVPSHDNAAGTGDDYATVTISYSAPDADNDGETDADSVVQLLFGGHTAASLDELGWGAPYGSANINGGPYHIKWTSADGSSIGNRDNQIQGGAILKPALNITKTADAASVDAGSPIGYTITVSNTGTDAASNVTLTDSLPVGTNGIGLSWSIAGTTGTPTCAIEPASGPDPQTLTCTKASLAVNTSFSVHVTSPTTVGSEPCTSTTFTNTARAGADGVNEITASAQTSVTCPRLSITKTADAAGVTAGQPIGFTMTVTNDGDGNASNVSLTDALPVGSNGLGLSWSIAGTTGSPTCAIDPATGPAAQTLTCTKASLAPGASFSVHVTSPTTVASDGCTSTSFPNTARVNASNNPEQTANASTTVGCPGLSVEKTADAATVNAGDQIGFTVTVRNNTGAGDATSVSLTDALPVGAGGIALSWSIESTTGSPSCAIDPASGPAAQTLTCTKAVLAGGESFSVHVVSATPAANGCTDRTFTNTAQAQASNNPQVTAQASTTVECADIDVTKTADQATVTAGDPIGFTITVANTGNGDASNVSLTDALPVGSNGIALSWSIESTTGSPTCAIDPASGPAAQTLTCTKAALASGDSFTVHVVSATPSANGCTTKAFPNTATATASQHPEVSGSATTTVECPNLAIVKTADAASVDAGSPIGFRITVTNNGDGAANSVSLSDALPVGTNGIALSWSIVQADSTGEANCTISPASGPDAQTLTCSTPSLPAGSSFSVHVVSNTPAPQGCTDATFPNTAQVSAANNPQQTSQATTTVNCPDLSITKTPDAPSVDAGDPIGFTITVTNDGNGDAPNVSLTDALPVGSNGIALSWSIAGTTGDPTCAIDPATGPAAQTLTCTKSSLPAGASFSVHVTSPTTVAGSCTTTTFTNVARVGATTNPVQDATATTAVNCPGLGITKTADAQSVSAGSPIGFTITVSNTAGDGVGTANNVSLTDALPVGSNGIALSWSIAGTTGDPTCAIDPATGPAAQTLTCSKASLPAGQSFSVHVVSNTPAANGCTDTTFPNSASASASNHAQVTGSASTTVLCPDLDVTKTADAASVSAGSPIGFTITVTNGGNGDATNVSLSDALPVGSNGIALSWSIAGTTGSPVCAIDPASGPAAQTLTCTKAVLGAGETFTVHVVSDTPAGDGCTATSFPNTATATASNNPAASGSATTTVNCPHLLPVKTADAPSVTAGAPIGFTITVTNDGSGDATGVSLTDALPVGANGIELSWTIAGTTGDPTCAIDPTSGPAPQTLTCTKAVLPAGASFSVHVTSPTTVPAQCTTSTFTNVASVDASNAASQTAQDSTAVQCPSLGIVKTADAQSVSAGSPIGFTITVTNNPGEGVGPATDVEMTDVLPVGSNGIALSWSIAGTTGSPLCVLSPSDGPAQQTLTCSKASLAPGESFSVHVISDTPAPQGCTDAAYPNTASADAENAPQVTATDSVTVRCPSLAITKTADSAGVDVGQQVGFTVTVSNTGTGTATDVSLSDLLPVGSNNIALSWSIESTTGDPVCAIDPANGPAQQTLTCTKATLDPGASFTVHVVSSTTRTGACLTTTLNNTATVSASNAASNNASASTEVRCAADLNAAKSSCPPPGTAAPGGYLTYSIAYANNGTATAHDVVITDTLDPNVSYVSAGQDGVYDDDTRTITWTIGDLTPGQSGTVTFSVQVDPETANNTQVHNTGTITSTENSDTFSLDTLVSIDAASTSGSATSLKVTLLGQPLGTPLDDTQSTTADAANPHDAASHTVLPVGLSGVVQADVITDTSTSDVDTSARSLSTTRVAGVNILNGAITASEVYGVSQSVSSALGTSWNSTGSHISNLKVNNQPVPLVDGDVAPNTHVFVADPVVPGRIIAEAWLYEESGSEAEPVETATSHGVWTASHSVDMIHVKLLVGYGPLLPGTEIFVGSTDTAATYPSGLACGDTPPSVTGRAFTTYARGTLGVPGVVPMHDVGVVQLGDADIPAYGGSNSDHYELVSIQSGESPDLVGTGANNTACGSIDDLAACGGAIGNPHGRSRSIVKNLDLLDGFIHADLLDVAVSTLADGSVADVDYQTAFLNLVIMDPTPITGGPIVVANNPEPNTTYVIPVLPPDGQLVTVTIILNEQITNTQDATDAEGTVNAIHVLINGPDGVLDGEIIVASAHSGSHA